MNPPAGTMSPEVIDAAIIQLNTMLDTVAEIPGYVKESGKAFTAALDKWSEEKKAERAK